MLSDTGSVIRVSPFLAAASVLLAASGAADLDHMQNYRQRESPGILLLSQATSASSALRSTQCLSVPCLCGAYPFL